ncbi:hypothetical protein SK128_022416 [Halocaridina rubra]|uniref:Uncharacterized protein n=1 Tax=Halocaridina rubra TaxID=373956 RepID=A0AAN8WVR7_HALRR
MKKLVERGLVKGDTLQTLASNFEESGPGSMARGRMLVEALMNTSNSKTVPSSLVRYLPSSSLRSFTAADVKDYIKNAEGKGWQLDDAQKAALLTPLGAGDFSSLPPSLKSALPTSSLDSLNSAQLQEFARGLPANSPANLKISSTTFSQLRNVTLANVRSNVRALPIMSSFDANRINEREIVDVLAEFSKAEEPPSMDVCRNLKNKMIQYSMIELDPDSPTEVAQMMTVGEAENTPPCVLGALGRDAYENLRPEVKTVIMQNMGKADNSMSIPRQMRQFILQEGLRPLGRMNMIRGDLLNDLDRSIVDLSPEQIRMIEPTEALNFLMKMEMAFRSHNKPCLDGGQRREIGAMLERVKG